MAQESPLRVVPAVASDENTWSSAESIAVCSKQDPKRTQITSKGFEEVINAKQEELE